jgi:hypothetical protein
MEEIQAVNGARKAAIEAGMPVQDAMDRWKTAADVEVVEAASQDASK